ncbi:MAG TPA: 5-formyltetrahydrofolate cyclo-ligase [Xanthomonadales bacterium]|nr:5-formyltetrahydrofolate cyclo-ligase [Xanthomonadales bacterium]
MKHTVSESEEIQQRKKHLRSSMRKRRRMLDQDLRRQLNTTLNQQVLERLSALPPCLLAAYLAFDGEPDLASSFPALLQAGFGLVLPFIESHGNTSHMVFRHWHPEDSLSRNSLGFAEPHLGKNVDVSDLGVILLPLVAWDRTGARLGMGAGYYDRALEKTRNSAPPLRIGIAFDVQRTDCIPIDPHDVPLHELITDRQRFTFRA